MTSRERIKTIYAGGKPDRCGFWLGMPHPDSWPAYFQALGMRDKQGKLVSGEAAQEEFRRRIGDDFRHIGPQWSSYKHPQNKPMWEDGHDQQKGLASAGVFADCEDVRQVEDFPWPNPDYLDFTQTVAALKNAGDVYRASGMWCCFFHNVADFFGMENYFIKMYTHPEVVHAVTAKVCEFYLEANERFFAVAKDEMDASFIGNDFGTQLDLFISPAQFDEFIMPWFTKFTEQGHRHGYQVLLHSCGSIYRVIDRLIAAGVDALHPLQAKAVGMDAASLARDFHGRIAFQGAIDTQELLVHGTPDEVRAEVHRVRKLLGPNYVVSPSHETILPNVPAANVLAMAEAACGD